MNEQLKRFKSLREKFLKLSKGGQEPNVCLMPEMSVKSKVELPESKTSRCRQRSERRSRKVFNLARPKMFVQNLPPVFLLLAIIRNSSLVQNEVDKATRLLQFLKFVHLPFSFRSLDLFCNFTLVYEGHFILCYKEKIELLDRVKANFERS